MRGANFDQATHSQICPCLRLASLHLIKFSGEVTLRSGNFSSLPPRVCCVASLQGTRGETSPTCEWTLASPTCPSHGVTACQIGVLITWTAWFLRLKINSFWFYHVWSRPVAGHFFRDSVRIAFFFTVAFGDFHARSENLNFTYFDLMSFVGNSLNFSADRRCRICFLLNSCFYWWRWCPGRLFFFSNLEKSKYQYQHRNKSSSRSLAIGEMISCKTKKTHLKKFDSFSPEQQTWKDLN